LTLLQKGQLDLPAGNQQLPAESFDYYCSRIYVAVGKLYEENPEIKELRAVVLHAIEHGEELESGPDYPLMAAELSHSIVQAHLKTMSRLNISYDLLTWESAILGAGLWRRTFEMLRERGLLEKPETGKHAGWLVLPCGEGEVQTDEGDHSSDKVLVKSDGTDSYTAKDISNQLWKFGLTDDSGVKFDFALWGIQHDGRRLWSMLITIASTDSGERADPLRGAAADVEFSDDRHPPRPHHFHQVVEDRVHHRFVKDPFVAEGEEIELQAFHLYAVPIGDVTNGDGREIRLPGHGAQAGELRRLERDLVIALGVGVRKGR